MLLELLMEDERREGRKEGELRAAIEMLQIALEKFGQLPSSLLEALHQQQDIDKIKSWMQTALAAQSLDEFISKM